MAEGDWAGVKQADAVRTIVVIADFIARARGEIISGGRVSMLATQPMAGLPGAEPSWATLDSREPSTGRCSETFPSR